MIFVSCQCECLPKSELGFCDTGRLRQLLRDAANVLDEDLAAGKGLPQSERLHLQQHLAVCDQAAALVDDPEQIMPPAPYSAV